MLTGVHFGAEKVLVRGLGRTRLRLPVIRPKMLLARPALRSDVDVWSN